MATTYFNVNWRGFAGELFLKAKYAGYLPHQELLMCATRSAIASSSSSSTAIVFLDDLIHESQRAAVPILFFFVTSARSAVSSSATKTPTQVSSVFCPLHPGPHSTSCPVGYWQPRSLALRGRLRVIGDCEAYPLKLTESTINRIQDQQARVDK